DKINSSRAQTFSSFRSAIRPVGRSTSINSSIANTTRSISPEPRYCTVKASMTPTRMPARMVPCMLPKPPMMTMAKALTITDAQGLAREGRVELVRYRPEERELRVLEQYRHADRRDQGPQLVAAIAQRREHRRVHRQPEQRARAERGEHRQQVGAGVRQSEDLGGEPRRGEERGERADGDEVGVREVDLVQHP